ncbi:DUF3592 domain-containing protein [Streptomyces sp. QHH-9511]|uniref:DUF3592 domain-containing protein n=1 Tax=Streptomyces sp. QHH-9511 TaxID=2684468 RepID=UPI001315C0E8|nr:DUF3592 domain-containing protein [Streptomyces sp. QHH-9511]QGZ52635.1 DUF3592 domain-containing protein [Streptomyces sp. QHH-9511]
MKRSVARRKYRYGRSVWTTFTGWGMVLSAAGAIGCVLWGVGPYPPLHAETAMVALSLLFAAAWIISSLRASRRKSYWLRRGPASARPFRHSSVDDGEYGSRTLVWFVALLVPLATLACFAMGLMVSPEYGRETARLDAAGWGEHPATVVRLAGDPVRGQDDPDGPVYYETDLVLRVPYDDGPREVTKRAMTTRHAPKAGTTIQLYYAPGDPRPDSPVLTDGRRQRPGLANLNFHLILGLVLIVPPAAILKGALEWDMTSRVRRFSPVVHLPALGILVLGLLLLLPTALGGESAGPASFLSCVTPGAALAWVWRTA